MQVGTKPAQGHVLKILKSIDDAFFTLAVKKLDPGVEVLANRNWRLGRR